MRKISPKKDAQMPMDKSDIEYVLELIDDALRDQEWDSIHEAKDFLKEYLDDDGGPIGLEE